MNEYSRKKIRYAKALEEMFKNVQSGDKIYIVFSKNSFRSLVFTLGMGMIANLILVYLLYTSLTGLVGISTISYILYIAVLFLCSAAIVSGIWLVFKGIDIVTDK